MQCSKWIVHSVLLFTVPSIALYPQDSLPVIIQNQETVQKLQMESLSYDDILNLIDDLEDGELEKRCSPEDLEKINYFLANLAKEGVLPNEIEEEFVLENDIGELLHGEDNQYAYAFFQERDFIIPPAFYYQGEVILCKSWIHKKWNQTKKFVKKHKKAIIIGAAVIVAAVVVVGVVAACTASAAAAGAAASGSDKEDKTKEPETTPPSISNDSSSEVNASEDSILKQVLEEQISSFKENIEKEHFFQIHPSIQREELSWEENARVLGSLLGNNLIKQYEESQFYFLPKESTPLDFGHQEVDRKFSTNYASFYTNPSLNADFNALSYQVRGEKALEFRYFDQAVDDLGKAIELDPTNPIPYLKRGVAHFGLGQYDRSLEDYHQFTSQAQKTCSFSISDFSLGFSKGLPKGIYESGEGLFLLLSDLVIHPIHTGEQMWTALNLLSELACSEQWGSLSEALAPEVHKLVTEWNTLPSEMRGELAGYALGKYGSNIVIPSVVAKAISNGVKGAQELSAVYRSLQTAEETLLLESVAGLESGAKIGEVIQARQTTIALGKELGFTTREMAELKQAGNLEGTLNNAFETIAKDPAMLESIQRFKKAEAFLESYGKKFIPETEVRELIHQTGILTFPRPKGIPENFRVRLSNGGAGMLYVHPKNTHISVRVMPGKPHSPFLHQQKPYIIQMKDGKAFDKYGKLISHEAPEAHIPIEEFIYRE